MLTSCDIRIVAHTAVVGASVHAWPFRTCSVGGPLGTNWDPEDSAARARDLLPSSHCEAADNCLRPVAAQAWPKRHGLRLVKGDTKVPCCEGIRMFQYERDRRRGRRHRPPEEKWTAGATGLSDPAQYDAVESHAAAGLSNGVASGQGRHAVWVGRLVTRDAPWRCSGVRRAPHCLWR